MKRPLSVFLTLLVVSSVATAPAAAIPLLSDSTDDPEVIQYGSQNFNSFVVGLEDNSSSELESWLNESDDRTLRTDHSEQNIVAVSAPDWEVDGDTGIFSVAVSDPGAVPDALRSDALSENEWVRYVSPNYRLSYADPVDELQNESEFSAPTKFDGFRTHDLPTDGIAFTETANESSMAEARAAIGADNVTATGDSATRPIAVIDSGLNTRDGELMGNGTAGSEIRVSDASKDFIENETVAQDGLTALDDPNGHGTYVKSQVAADTSDDTYDGVAPDATVLALRALDEDGSGSTADIVASVAYSAEQNASVLSMSLGSPVYSEALATELTDAREQGTLPVVAVGNSRSTVRWTGSPSDDDAAIGVAAVTGDEPATAKVGRFSQVGPDPGTTDQSGLETNGASPDVAAPGVKVTAMVVTDSGVLTTETMSGTSMSTPLVAASAYILRAQEGTGVDETEERITDNVRPIPNAGVNEVGNGSVAVDRALDNTQPDQSQDDARTDAAVTRDETFESLSKSSGGVLGRIPVVG